MFLPDGTPRGHYEPLHEALTQYSSEELVAIQERVTRSFSDEGITFTVYGDEEAKTTPECRNAQHRCRRRSGTCLDAVHWAPGGLPVPCIHHRCPTQNSEGVAPEEAREAAEVGVVRVDLCLILHRKGGDMCVCDKVRSNAGGD